MDKKRAAFFIEALLVLDLNPEKRGKMPLPAPCGRVLG